MTDAAAPDHTVRDARIAIGFVLLVLLLGHAISLFIQSELPANARPGGIEPGVKLAVRAVLGFGLVWFLFLGKNWARWVLIVLLVLGSIFGVVVFPKLWQGLPQHIAVLFALYLAGTIISALVLLFSPAVARYVGR